MKPSIKQQDIRHLIVRDFLKKTNNFIPNGIMVLNLFDNRYRIYIRGDDKNIKSSHFIHANQNGEITYCNPQLERLNE